MSTSAAVIIEPYLFFPGTCEEAIEFYKTALDATCDCVMRYSDSPEPAPPGTVQPGFENKVMHATFHVGGSAIMASDDGCGEARPFGGFSLTIALSDKEQATKYFNALAEGGAVTMPLGETFWSPLFGSVTDKFGVNWMINVLPATPSAQASH